LDKIFDIFDEDNTGKINLNNLKKIAKELGESMSNEELSEMLERASTSGKEISKEDFYNIMTK
jgi:centrin-1